MTTRKQKKSSNFLNEHFGLRKQCKKFMRESVFCVSLHLIEDPNPQSACKMGPCLWSGSILVGATILKDCKGGLRLRLDLGLG